MGRTPEILLQADMPPHDDTALEFQAQSIISHLAWVVRNCPTPFHIALFAPWGTGKTTVIDSLYRKLTREDSWSVKVVRIDAWKHRDESMRRRLLLDAAAKLDPDMVVDLQRQLYKPLNNMAAIRVDWHGIFRWRTWWRHILTFSAIGWRAFWYLGTVVSLTAMLGLLKTWSVGGTSLTQLWATKRSANFPTDFLYRWASDTASVAAAPLLVAVVGYLVSAFARQYTLAGGDHELSGTDQYEERFRRALRTLPSGRRLVVIVDELDRCPPEKILEILETVRVFMNQSNCVFLVTCDRDVLERAVTNSNQSHGRTAPEYLEKIFELTVTLPPAMPANMQTYGERLLANSVYRADAEGIKKSGALEVLLWSGVETPRKAKRLVNDFLVRRELIATRCPSLLDDLPILAKITVLSQAFPGFVRHLMEEPELMTWMDMVRRGRLADLAPYQVEACKNWYMTTGSGALDPTRPKSEAAELVRFLGETWQHDADGLTVMSHLFLAFAPAESVVGDRLRQVQHLAEAGQAQSLISAVQAAGTPDAILHHLSGLVRNSRGTRQKNLILSLLCLGPLAQPTNAGTRLAARILGEFVELFRSDGMTDVVPLTYVLPYFEDMTDKAKLDWTELLVWWVEQDPKRGASLFQPEHCSIMPVTVAQAAGDLQKAVWVWLNSFPAQEELDYILPGLLTVAPLRATLYHDFYARTLPCLAGTSLPEDRSYVGQLFHRLVRSLERGAKPSVAFGQYERLLAQLLAVVPPQPDDWLITHLRDETDVISERHAPEFIRLAIRRAEGWKDSQETWAALIRFISEQIRRHALNDPAFHHELISALQPWAGRAATHARIWRFMRSQWEKAEPKARGYLCDAIVQTPLTGLNRKQRTDITGFLKENAGQFTEAQREAFYRGLIGSLSSEPVAMLEVMDPVLEHLAPMFIIPQSVVSDMLLHLRAAAFQEDGAPQRVGILRLLLKSMPLFGPEAARFTLESILSIYVSQETNATRLQATVELLAGFSRSLPLQDESVAKVALDLVEAIMHRRSILEKPDATCTELLRKLRLPRLDRLAILGFLSKRLIKNPSQANTLLLQVTRPLVQTLEYAIVHTPGAEELKPLLDWVEGQPDGGAGKRLLNALMERQGLDENAVRFLKALRTHNVGLAEELTWLLQQQLETGEISPTGTELRYFAALLVGAPTAVRETAYEVLIKLIDVGEDAARAVTRALPELLPALSPSSQSHQLLIQRLRDYVRTSRAAGCRVRRAMIRAGLRPGIRMPVKRRRRSLRIAMS